MVLLSDAGWSAPRIAAHLGYCGQTVRDLLRAFLARGTRRPLPVPHPGPPPTSPIATASPTELTRLLAEDRTWTSRQLGRGPRRAGHRPGAQAGPPPSEADEGRLPPHRLDPEAQAGPGQGRASRPHPGQPQGEGGRRASWSCTTSTSAASRRRCRSATAGPCRGSGS